MLLLLLMLFLNADAKSMSESRISQIINGLPSVERRIFFVKVSFENRFSYCGGTIIERRWVITASHCVEDAEPEDIFIEIGDFSREDMDPKYLKVDMKLDLETSVEDGQTINDIALLRLKTTLHRKFPVLPLCAFEREYGTRMSACGMGSTDPRVFIEPMTLRETSFLKSRYHSETTEHCRPENVCTERISDGANLCFMDDGGPLYVTDCETSQPKCLYGVASYYLQSDKNSSNKCDGGSVFANIPFHYDWIRSVIAISTP